MPQPHEPPRKQGTTQHPIRVPPKLPVRFFDEDMHLLAHVATSTLCKHEMSSFATLHDLQHGPTVEPRDSSDWGFSWDGMTVWNFGTLVNESQFPKSHDGLVQATIVIGRGGRGWGEELMVRL